jgi:hypothetical protein
VRDSRVLLGRGSCTNGPDPLQVRPGFGPVCGFAEFIPVPARYLIKVNKDLPFEQRRLERARWREQLVKLRQSVSSPMRKRLERPPKGDAKALPKANPVWVRGCESGSGELFDYRLQYGVLTFGRRIGP